MTEHELLRTGTIPLSEVEASKVEELRADPGILGLTRDADALIVTLSDGTEVTVGG